MAAEVPTQNHTSSMTSRLVSRVSVVRHALLASAVALAACTGGDTNKAPEGADTSFVRATKLWQDHKKSIDSLVAAAPTVQAVAQTKNATAKIKGPQYDVADEALTAIVRREAEKTRYCYTDAQKSLDPYLTMVATVLLNYGAAGWDLVRVEDWKSSSPAGDAVVTCIDANAKAKWQLPQPYAKPGPHLVQFTFRPDSAIAVNSVLKPTGRQ